MANIINRAQYGNLSCMWAVFQSRFTQAGDSRDISELKVSERFELNPPDICTGAEIAFKEKPFPKSVAIDLGRERYCPHLEARTDDRICQWVQAKGDDTQKSKAVGQAAISLEFLGLGNLNLTKSGRARSITWTKEAEEIHDMDWGDPNLESYIFDNLMSYGPLIGFAYYLMRLNKLESNRFDIRNEMMVLPSSETVPTKCDNGTITDVMIWDGNTSTDAATRTTTALFILGSSIGITTPTSFPRRVDQTPSSVSDWLNRRALDGKKSFPRKYRINQKKIHDLFDSIPIVRKGISYIHFIPKATDRNKGNRCLCCGQNVVNNARKQFGPSSRNRKMLLLEALRIAGDEKKLVNLKELSKMSLGHKGFYTNKETQFDTLINIERENVIFYGSPNQIVDDYMLNPLVRTTTNTFGDIPRLVETKISQILNEDDVFCGM
ncbi:MAG: hypothetical protein ACFFER_14145 [Candidatus Thorarchaeota archaeon]